MEITYQINPVLKAMDMADMFRKSGIKRPIDDLERIQRMIENASVTIAAWDGSKLVGIARAITDFAYCCYLSDLAVDNEYQKLGIGQELVKQLREQLGDEVSLVLLSSPVAMEYYPKIGFQSTDKAFVIPRVR